MKCECGSQATWLNNTFCQECWEDYTVMKFGNFLHGIQIAMRPKTDYEQSVTRDCTDRARQMISGMLHEAARRLIEAAKIVGNPSDEYNRDSCTLVARSAIANAFASIEEAELVKREDENNELPNPSFVVDDVSDELHKLQMEVYCALNSRSSSVAGGCCRDNVDDANQQRVQSDRGTASAAF